MSDVPAALARRVVERADDRCEYCGLAQVGQEATFHMDHVTPLAAGGPTVADNLALACVSCSLRKGPRTSATDPDTGEPAPLFDPRSQAWADHFRWDGVSVVPLTSTGRATLTALDLNRPTIRFIRAEEASRGRHPPPGQ